MRGVAPKFGRVARAGRYPRAVYFEARVDEIEGWQVDEIALLQRCSASAVKSRLVRGRDRLRAYYEARHAAVPLLSGETP